MIDTSKDFCEITAKEQETIKIWIGLGWSNVRIKKAAHSCFQNLEVQSSQIRRLKDELDAETIFV